MSTQPTEPDWLQAWNEGRVRTAGGKFPAGMSGNPNGKASGTKNRRTLLAEALQERGEAIARAMADKAEKGDVGAAALVLARLAPPMRARSERTPFALDTSKPLAQQAAAVVQAVADGDLSAEEAHVVLSCLQTYATLAHADTIEGRLQALERASALRNPATRGGVIEMDGPMQ